MRRRSFREIGFRLRQETRNALWLLRAPRVPELTISPLPLPNGQAVADALRETPFARETLARGEAFLQGEVELFGRRFATGRDIEWRKDYTSGKSTGPAYFRTVPYLDFKRAGDHKTIWELNRHQHLVALAQAYLFSRDTRFLNEVERQLQSWMEQNPFLRGINWASALEVAFRALSWIWIDHLVGADLPVALRRDIHRQLYLHGLYLHNNLSVYFSPNTHLTGEATALHALGCLLSQEEWKTTAERVMDRELLRQVRDDGSYFEQSTYYHVYSLDIFLFHAVVRGADTSYRDRLTKLADFLDALLGPCRELSFFGDDDGGRFFHPYGSRAAFGRASIAAASQFLGQEAWEFSEDDAHEIAAWWLGVSSASMSSKLNNRLFPDAGMAVIFHGPWQLNMDAGPFGPAPSSHSHADTLSFTLRSREEEILIDPGTCTYVADSKLRNIFRSTAMHNTVRIDGLDQASPAGPFRWEHLPEVSVRRFSGFEIEAECRYRGFVHTRKLSWIEAQQLVILDEITGPAGVHVVEQFWHPGSDVVKIAPAIVRIGQNVEMSLARDPEIGHGGEFGWRSDVYGTKREAPAISVKWETELPWRAETVLHL